MTKSKNNKIGVSVLVLTLLFLSAKTPALSQEPQVGQAMPPWTTGCLDIHHINTGKGECSFFIFPDGTTMLVDAGVTRASKPRVTDPKPNDSRTPGQWISRYILHFMDALPEKKLHYVMASHFHEDHLGGVAADTPASPSGSYRLTGLVEVAHSIPCGTLIDRGWPDYDWPVPPEGESAKNYIQFARSQVAGGTLRAERFRVGANDQLVLVKTPQEYPDFEIRNLAANGHVWTGVGSVERNHFPALADLEDDEYPSENACSIAFRLSYGRFDYFSGGDVYSVTAHLWQDIETPAALVTGPVEVCKANHHANFDAMGASCLQALRPRVIIIHTWLAQQPDMVVLRRMLSTRTYPGPRDVFATNIMNETRIVVGPHIDKLKSEQGHVVVRVSPGGRDYRVFVLDDSAETFEIKAICGPYNSD